MAAMTHKMNSTIVSSTTVRPAWLAFRNIPLISKYHLYCPPALATEALFICFLPLTVYNSPSSISFAVPEAATATAATCTATSNSMMNALVIYLLSFQPHGGNSQSKVCIVLSSCPCFVWAPSLPPLMGDILFCSTTNETGLVRLVRQDTETPAEILQNQEGVLHGCITLTPLDPFPPFPTLQGHGDSQHA